MVTGPRVRGIEGIEGDRRDQRDGRDGRDGRDQRDQRVGLNASAVSQEANAGERVGLNRVGLERVVAHP